jgi:hypothetical protein
VKLIGDGTIVEFGRVDSIAVNGVRRLARAQVVFMGIAPKKSLLPMSTPQ